MAGFRTMMVPGGVIALHRGAKTEPDIVSDDWDDWWETHNEMPYVYQLPVDEKIKSWMYKRFRFDLDSSLDKQGDADIMSL